jgi:hypothetical protein
MKLCAPAAFTEGPGSAAGIKSCVCDGERKESRMCNLGAFFRRIGGSTILAMCLMAQTPEAVADGKSLEAKEVRALFPGKYEAQVRGYKIVVIANQNGSLAGSAFNRSDKGRWWVKSNNLCVAWSNWTDGKPTCGRISRSGSWYVSYNASGNLMKFRRN